LDKTYERMLYSIEEESVEDAKRILTLLCTAKRPLRVEELIDGIAVELGDDPKFNEDSRLMNVNDIRHICPGFIEVDLEVTVRIAHYSVQEYLESDRILTSGTARFSVRRAQANTEVASICLAYLLDPGLSEAYLNQVEDFHDKYPLAAYAASNWSEHYHEGSPSDPRLHHLALALFHDDQVALVSWANIYKWGGYKRDGLGDRILSPLYLAARLGLDPVVRVLADETAAARPSKNYFELALIAAATHGHATSVQLLLDHGVAIDYQGFEGTALHTAAQNGHVRVVEILLNHGADIEAQDYRCRSALYKAVSTGQDDIVRLLLDRGADVSPLGTYNTPLECAASNGREAMVGMLLDHGATPNRGRYHLPLSGALDDARVARLLIDRGAVINQGHLTSACFSGSPGVVALLLDRGADVDHAGGLANLLENAVSGENIGVLELLLDRNSDVRRTGVLTDLLEREVGTSKVDIVRVLLDRINNDDGIGSGSGKTTGSGDLAGLLERAAGCAELDVVRLLLDRGADPNKGQNRTPLEVAVSRGSTDVLELLLRKGADVNAGGEMTPLEKAAWERNVDIVRFLLREGADVDLGIRMTPLEAAASGKAEDIMKLLLEKGADANKGVQMTPLETLVDGGVEPFSMVELLVQRGADVNRGLKMNPLQVAKDKGHDLESITVLPDRNNSSEELGEPTIMKGLILEPVGTWGQPLTEKALDMPLLPALASLETSRLVDRTYSVEQQGIPIGVGSPQTKGVGDERHVIELAAS
jgi:ankyrin repeat protein